jgi:hypothetical protein
MIENVRSGGQLVLSDAQLFGQAGGMGFQQFQAANSVDGMGGVQLPDGVHIVFPTGGVLNKQTGGLFGPPLEAFPLADWRLKHATAWHKAKVAEFEEAKRQATIDYMNEEWIPHLKKLQGTANQAQQNLKECAEAYETACGRGPDWRSQQEQRAEQAERSRQAEDARRSRALAAIHAITIEEDVARDDDE